MPPVLAGALSDAGALALLGLLLVLVGVFAALWLQAGVALLGALLRGAVTLGLYDPERRTGRAERGPRRDRAVLAFTRALQGVSRLVPGTPRTNSRTIILPLLVVGVPACLVLLIVLWAVPAALFGFVVTTAPTPWSLALALCSLVAYFAGFLSLVSLSRRLPARLADVRP